MGASESKDQVDVSSVQVSDDVSLIERYFGFKAWKFLLALSGVVLVALYISNLLFGNASLGVLMKLERYEVYLVTEIARLKQENAQLQKEYFELKELSPSTAEKQ